MSECKPNFLEGPAAAHEQPGRYSTSLWTGLGLLSAFDGEHPLLGIAEFADALGIARSTAHRYAVTLVALGYLEQDDSRRYRLASRAADVGLAVLTSHPVREYARRWLRELRNRTGYSASLWIPVGAGILCADRFAGHRRGQYEADQRLWVGARLPSSSNAAGRALLAAQSEMAPTGRRVPPSGAEWLIEGWGDLLAELERILARGVAVSDQEIPGVYAVAAAVTEGAGRAVAALQLTLPSALLVPQLADRLACEITRTAREISGRVGPHSGSAGAARRASVRL